MKLNLASPKVVSELMKKYKITPLKRFGQNFLIDGNIAHNIAVSATPEGACVLEIGPGLGALTQKLLERAKMLGAYEIDAGLAAALSDIFEDVKKIKVFHKDFLKADIESDLQALFGDTPLYVAANLPYYITSPCLFKLLESKLSIKMITVMVQKEVAERICAQPGSKSYGTLSATAGFFAKPELLMNVSAYCFYPKPDVASAVVQLKMKPQEMGAEAYTKTVRGLFAKRRKTVKSNLRESFGLDLNRAESILDYAKIDEKARAEMLSVEDFKRITDALQKEIEKQYPLE